MNRFLLRFSVLLLTLSSLASCAAGGALFHSKAGSGSIFTDVKQPLIATNESGDKVGQACAHNILGIAAFGDASIAAAKMNGGIDTVVSVDEEILNILGIIYGEYCTIVTGY